MAGGITSEKQKDPKRVATSSPGSFFGKDLAVAGHVPHQKFRARGGVGKVSNYINMLPVGYSLKNINFANFYVQNTC
jgi:hypothetical protein